LLHRSQELRIFLVIQTLEAGEGQATIGSLNCEDEAESPQGFIKQGGLLYFNSSFKGVEKA
jgi:hypothetical protein